MVDVQSDYRGEAAAPTGNSRLTGRIAHRPSERFLRPFYLKWVNAVYFLFMNNLPSSRRLRTGRISIPGQVYLVTTVTRERETVFEDLPAARQTIRSLMKSDARGHAKTLAFVLMPDHLHWMVQLGNSLSLSRVVQQMKSFSAHAAGTPLWQPGFHDHALRSDEDLRAAARYLVANPLRAGLVRHVGDYPHWDAVWL
ncbi:transposase [Methyloversatilis sp. XJ19-49]|uniref:REP-associated tyrosine transposase n=1 Tax=Methyloversatilis sp. XJ19-49 TaxID=2963429 RepID=UPI00211BA902|nr:transposase [Methyloversatilis sp. XJ19-49]MCQ9380129.1 transposase [Methyloversatilis sp. XJ19-49]